MFMVHLEAMQALICAACVGFSQLVHSEALSDRPVHLQSLHRNIRFSYMVKRCRVDLLLGNERLVMGEPEDPASASS